MLKNGKSTHIICGEILQIQILKLSYNEFISLRPTPLLVHENERIKTAHY